jgi:hypothetical protein
VILTGAEGRREIDLVPPPATARAAAPSAGTLPEPVCPSAQVSSLAAEGHEEPPAPGTSPVDEGLSQLRSLFQAEEGGAS